MNAPKYTGFVKSPIRKLNDEKLAQLKEREGKELPLSTIVNAIVAADKANKFYYKYKKGAASMGILHQQLQQTTAERS